MSKNNNKKLNTLLVIFAQEEEYNAFFKDLKYQVIELSNGLNLTKARINKKTLYSFYSGVGKTANAFKLGLFLSIIKPDLIIDVGVAGSISSKLKSLDVVVADKTCYYDADLTAFGYHYGAMSNMPLYFECDKDVVEKLMSYHNPNNMNLVKGLIITGDTFVTKNKINSEWFNLFTDPIACDMESASVGQVAHMTNTPYVVVRSISDEAKDSEDNKNDYNSQLDNASLRAAKLVKQYITSNY